MSGLANSVKLGGLLADRHFARSACGVAEMTDVTPEMAAEVQGCRGSVRPVGSLPAWDKREKGESEPWMVALDHGTHQRDRCRRTGV